MRTMSGKTDTYVYLDYAAATPVSSAAQDAYTNALQHFANPQALHTPGLQAAQVRDEARRAVAGVLGVKSRDVVFTSGGTEGNNLVLGGYIAALVAGGKKLNECHVVVSAMEHPSVLEVLTPYIQQGLGVSMVRPSKDGVIKPEAVQEALQSNTVLASVALVNSETGTVQPIHAIAKMLQRHAPQVRFHTDACQALYHSVVAQGLGVDFLVLDSGKVYGPRGIGAIYIRHGVSIEPVLRGGSQEGGLRGGTENVALSAGFAAALVENNEIRKKECTRLEAMRGMLIETLKKDIEGLVINGTGKEQSPHILNISIPNIHAEYLVAYLDQRGFGISTKSACLEQADVSESHVVRALAEANSEKSTWRARNTLRISFGRDTTEVDARNLASALTEAVQQYYSFEMNS